MALNKYFTYDFEDRPKPKLWLLKPDFTRIERITAFSKLQGTFKYSNMNQLTFQLSPVEFDELEHEEQRNPVFDLIQNKYLIEYEYNGYKDYLVIDDIKKVSNESDNILIVADSLCNELSKKTVNEIELLGSTIKNSMAKVLSSYAPLWSVGYVDTKLKDVKRELTMQNSTVMGVIDQLNTLFDSVAIFDNGKRKISFYHKDNVGVNRGLRIRENSYLKSFEDSNVSKDIITRLYAYGNNGLTIQSVNPAGTDYIEDFSYFMYPFKRDINRNVLSHSNYMTDELCHALLDYQDYYDSKKISAEEISKRYKDLLFEHSNEKFKLNQLSATLDRLTQRKEILTPKSEYVDLGERTENFKITVEKSSYYVLMLKSEGSLTRVRFQTNEYDIPSNEWLYLKIDTGDFQDALKYKDKLQYEINILSANPRIRAVLTRSSKNDYEDMETKEMESKYNYVKYKQLVNEQSKIVAAVERRMKLYESEKDSLINSMNPKNFLSPSLYKEREQYVYSAIWQEENHTEPSELYEDAIKQMKEQRKLNRNITIGIVNFVQSLEHKEDWNKLIAGDIITFSNKMFREKLQAYITDIQINFEDNNVTLTISDVIDFKNMNEKVSDLIASTASNAAQVNFQKEQIKSQTGKITKMAQLIEAEWDANKKRILAGNETVDIGSHGVKVVSNENPDEFVIMVGGVIAMTSDGGETFKTGVTPNGVNAEMLIGKMIVGETLTFENESGTFRYDKDGLHIDSSEFHLTTNDGNDYFEELRESMRKENKVLNDLIRDEFDIKINRAMSEALDVETVAESAANIINDSFSDGIINDIEKRLIKDTLSSLEKENIEFLQQVEMAYNSQYISQEDIINLDESLATYNGLYESLVMNINEILKLTSVTSQQGKIINDALIEYKEETKEIAVLITEILERNRDRQINSVVADVKDYAEKLSQDFKDEVKDLQKSLQDTNEYIQTSFGDNIFDTIEIENIKTMLMIVNSELGDITNRHNSVYNNTLLPNSEKAELSQKYELLKKANTDFSNYVTEMISDGLSDEQEKQNYQQRFDAYKNAMIVYENEYANVILQISNKYADNVENRIIGQFNGLKEELNNDLLDLKDNIGEIETTIKDTFEDSIITAQEKSRILTHLDMLDREFKDVEEQYNVLIANKYSSEQIRSEVGKHRSSYVATHSRLRTILTQVIEDGRIETEEREQVRQSLVQYSIDLSKYTSAITNALNNMSVNIASDVAATQAQQFNGILNEVNTNLDTLKKQVDGAIETFYYNYQPTLLNFPTNTWKTEADKETHIGDFFLDTKTGVAYRFLYENQKYLWKPIDDQVITDALNAAKTALDTADGKRRVFVNTPTPPYDEGDLWSQGTNGDLLVSIKSRSKGQLYVSSDWVRATKYTDDSKANEVLTQLNQFKDIAMRDLNRLKASTKELQDNVLDSFEDRVIELSEAVSINKHLNLIEQQNKISTNNYNNIIKNSLLPPNEKTTLTTIFNTYQKSYTELKNSIVGSIEDNKIANEELARVNKAFDSFNNNLAALSTALNNAISETLLNATKQLTEQMEARFEEWKSSEFRTSSEEIALRVSGSEWKDTYLPQVNKKIENIKVGGKNLLTGTTQHYLKPEFNNQATIETIDGRKTIAWASIINTTERVGMKKYDNVLETGKEYTFSFYAKANTDLGIKAISLNADNFGFLRDTAITQKWERYHFTFTAKGNLNYANPLFYLDSTTLSSTGKTLYVTDVQLEEGNVLSAAKPSPEELVIGIDSIKESLNSFVKLTDTAFKDGIIDNAEAKAIAQHIDTIQAEKEKLDSRYTILYNDNLLSDKKSALLTAKTNYNNAHSYLTTYIQDAIADNKITNTERSVITSRFNGYRTRLGELTTAIENANREISDKQSKQNSQNAINSLTVGGNNLIRSFNSNFGFSGGTIEGDYAARLPQGKTIHFYLYGNYASPLEPNTDYILQLHESDADVEMAVFYDFGRGILKQYTKNRVIKFNTEDKQNFRISFIARGDNQFIGKISLYKGNIVQDWSPSPLDTNKTLKDYGTKIEANSSFIKQNKDKIEQSVSRTELETNLQKIATYENSYTIQNGESELLREIQGNQFSDNYSYEVAAKTKSNTVETLAIALFTSKGVGKGFDLTVLDEKGTNGIHPAFELKNNKYPAIKTYQPQSSSTEIEVIYTKYLGTETNIQRTNSKIEQLADNITLEVKEVKENNEYRNLLSNSNFTTNGYWSDLHTTPNFAFPSLDTMSINDNENIFVNSAYTDSIDGSGSYRRVKFALSKPLEVGATYTIQFEMQSDAKISEMTILPYEPRSENLTLSVNERGKNTITFTPTAASTYVLFYVGLHGSTHPSASLAISKATIVKGTTPLVYKPNRTHRVVKLDYSGGSFPALASPHLPVDTGQDLSTGDEVTFSVYVYVPSVAKDLIKSFIYIELASYENTKQTSNPAFTTFRLQPSDIVTDRWIRISTTGTIPISSANGKTNYIRALMRYDARQNTVDPNLIFYYGLPMLEKGSVPTKWTLSPSDLIDPNSVASKISLTPESIEMISNNLRINTDIATIENTSGSMTLVGDTLTLSNKNSNDSVMIKPSGITMFKDGVAKINNGYDANIHNVQPYEPQAFSTNTINSISDTRYNYKAHVSVGLDGLYSLDWGTYSLGKTHKQLIEDGGTAWARVNRFTYEYSKRYLVILLSCKNSEDSVNLYLRWRTKTGGVTLHQEKISSKAWTYPKVVIDLEKKLGYKPNNKTEYFELQAHLTGAVANYQSGGFRITRAILTDIKPT